MVYIYITLFYCRFLARGDDYVTIAFSFRLGHSTVCEIVKETCDIIYKGLVDKYMPIPKSEQDWIEIANEYNLKWNFPYCVGAIDGKHVVIQAPPSSGSQYFNYKGSHSIVLLAVVNANYEFVLIDVGGFGRNSDGGILANSNFGKALENDELHMPKSCKLARNFGETPCVIVGDEAFPLKPYLMRPYPGRSLPDNKKIFNYRLSRARRVSENAFGVLAARWRFLRRLIHAKPETVVSYVKSACVLHNFLIKKTKHSYCPPDYVDHEMNGIITNGNWRTETDNVEGMQPIRMAGSNNSSKKSIQIREKLCEYFNSVGTVPWQNAVINR